MAAKNKAVDYDANYKLANHLIVRGKLIGWKITYNS